jgi:methyl-accepting chemotaxis protein
MRVFSIASGLVFRQMLFVGVIVALGVTAMFGAAGVRDLANQLLTASPQDMRHIAGGLAAQADWMAKLLIFGTAFACFLILGVSMPVMHRSLSQPINRLARQMTDLAAGNTEVQIVDGERRDEIGAIARALGVLRDAVKHNNDLMAELKARDDREARLLRDASIRAEVEEFNRELDTTTAQLGQMTKRMSEASDVMIVAARRATEGSSHAKQASSAAAANVSSVAMSSEQLLDSIEEINRQVVQSTTVVQKAVSTAEQSSAGMSQLSSAARRVGDVVSSISRIAAQTNLLALNATIEAARAGEAGRGFAVVAQEVKNLATQTAKATQDIADQIAAMQRATDMSVEAIETIRQKIGEVEHITTIIAAAVHEQGASTQEIARNVRSAASGASSMSEHVGSVEAAVLETGSNVESVVDLAHQLDRMAARMRARVEDFTHTLTAG